MYQEWNEVQKIKQDLAHLAKIETLEIITSGDREFPIQSFTFGSTDPNAPVLGIVGGVHGLERIGTWVAIAFLQYLASRITWDEGLHWQLQRMRIFIVPLVNPVGMRNFTRSNPNGVDLMRNAPVEATQATKWVGGHFISNRMPWYRGNPTQTFEGMEKESKALVSHCQNQIKNSKRAIILDLHSGFGLQDQIWFPYAKSKEPFPHLAELFTLKKLLDHVLPNHIYRVEPQAKNYTTHGDLWDYLYQLNESDTDSSRVFLPLTLEMGSWNWVKKNPIQLLSFLGAFNPVKQHRMQRTLRRHLPLFDFLVRALISNQAWVVKPSDRKDLESTAIREWLNPNPN